MVASIGWSCSLTRLVLVYRAVHGTIVWGKGTKSVEVSFADFMMWSNIEYWAEKLLYGMRSAGMLCFWNFVATDCTSDCMLCIGLSLCTTVLVGMYTRTHTQHYSYCTVTGRFSCPAKFANWYCSIHSRLFGMYDVVSTSVRGILLLQYSTCTYMHIEHNNILLVAPFCQTFMRFRAGLLK